MPNHSLPGWAVQHWHLRVLELTLSELCPALPTSCTQKTTQNHGATNHVKEHDNNTHLLQSSLLQSPLLLTQLHCSSVLHRFLILDNNVMSNFKLPCSLLAVQNMGISCVFVGISLPQAQKQRYNEQSTTLHSLVKTLCALLETNNSKNLLAVPQYLHSKVMSCPCLPVHQAKGLLIKNSARPLFKTDQGAQNILVFQQTQASTDLKNT